MPDALSVEQAWDAAHVDELFQESVWGEDHEAMVRRRKREADFQGCLRGLSPHVGMRNAAGLGAGAIVNADSDQARLKLIPHFFLDGGFLDGLHLALEA